MAKIKYYAIRKGRINNTIVTKWGECKGIVEGCSSEYKSFTNIVDAESYLSEGSNKLVVSALDKSICEMATSDSALKYAQHIRIYFDVMVKEIMELKTRAGERLLYDNVEDYLEFYFRKED